MNSRYIVFAVFTAVLLSSGAAFAQDQRDDPFGGGFSLPLNYGELIVTMGEQNDSLMGPVFDWQSDDDSIVRIGTGMFPESYQCGDLRDFASADFNNDHMEDMVMAWNRSDGGVYVGIPVYNLVTMVPYEWHQPNPTIDPGVLYATDGLAEILGEIRVVAGNFYADSAMEFVLAYLAADSTVTLTVFDVDSTTVTPVEKGSISDQAVNTEVALMQQKHKISRFDVTTGDLDGDGLDEIVLVTNDPAQSPATDLMVDIYDYDTLAHAITAISKMPYTANNDPDHTCLRRLAVTSGNFDSDSRREVAIMDRWADPEEDNYRISNFHILKPSSDLTHMTYIQFETLPAVPRWPDTGAYIGTSSNVHALLVFDNKLIVGGEFTQAGGISAIGIAAWDGSQWHALGGGMNGNVYALTVYNGDLIAGGSFTTAGGITARRVARWDGTQWNPVGNGVNHNVWALTVYNDDLIVGGYFDYADNTSLRVNKIARWDGSQWHDLDGGTDGVAVYALTVYDNDLIAAGDFTYVGLTGDDVHARRIARWDGTEWYALGEGFSAAAYALTVYNGDLIAGGGFDYVENVPRLTVNHIARWDGTQWNPVGNGVSHNVWGLTVYNDDLIVGGYFDYADFTSLLVNKIARWDGSTWYAMGSGMTNTVRALTVYTNKLIAGGDFQYAGGTYVKGIAAWDGSSWYPLLPSMEMPMDITTGNIDKEGSGGSIETDELIITSCRENAGTAEQYLKIYGFDSTSAVPSICLAYDTTVIASIAPETPSGDLYTSRRTMDLADVTGEGWVDLAMLLSDNSNGTEVEVLELYPDTTVDCTLDSIVTKGSWAAESDNISELVLADLDTATIELAAPSYYVVDSIIQPLVILNVPPVHFDILNGDTADVNERFPWPPGPDADHDTYCAYGMFQDSSTSVTSEISKDWGISAGLQTHFSTCGATVKAHLNTEYGEGFSVQGDSTITIHTENVMENHAKDMILAARISYDVWEYPVYLRGEHIEGADVVVINPRSVEKAWLDGRETESWIPDHEVDNIFSYRNYANLADNPMAATSNVVEGVSFLMSEGTKGHWLLTKSVITGSGYEASSNFGIEVGASIGYSGGLGFFGLGAKWGFEVSVEGTYDRNELRTYSTTVANADSVHVQYGYINSVGSDVDNRKYSIKPYAYWAKNGALVLNYAAYPTAGSGTTWWTEHYSDPDPAFILPWRLDPEKYGAADNVNRYLTREIAFIPKEPSPGDTVLIIARVHNFSLNPTPDYVGVSFYLGDPDKFGQLLYDKNTGDSIFYACDVDGVPTIIGSQGEAAAQIVWQVPDENDITKCQRIWALIDPFDDISPEIHDNDDEITNNKGWKLLKVNTTTECYDPDGDGKSASAYVCCPDTGDNCPDVYNPDQDDTDGDGIGDACDEAVCGDANGDFQVNVGDAVFLIAYIFKGGPPPNPVCAGNANGDTDTNVGDAVYIIAYVFKGGPAPIEGCCN